MYFLKFFFSLHVTRYVTRKLDSNIYIFFFKFQAVAMDTAAFGITCNALCPAWTDTPRKLLFFKNHYNMLIRSFFLFRENEN